MIHKTLGRTDLEVNQLGYGSMGIRGPKSWGVRVVSEEAADALLNSVLDAGINFIDTSPDYVISEQRVGQYISSRCTGPAIFTLNKNTSDLPFFGPIERVPDRVTNL